MYSLIFGSGQFGATGSGAMPNNGIEPASDLDAECGGQRMLHPGAAGDKRGPMFLRERAQRLCQAVQIASDQVQGLAQLTKGLATIARKGR